VNQSDRVRAVTRGSAVNHNGRSASVVAQKAAAQASVILDALQVEQSDIQYIEVWHGNAVGDGVEIEGLKSGFQKRSTQLTIGSIKNKRRTHLKARRDWRA